MHNTLWKPAKPESSSRPDIPLKPVEVKKREFAAMSSFTASESSSSDRGSEEDVSLAGNVSGDRTTNDIALIQHEFSKARERYEAEERARDEEEMDRILRLGTEVLRLREYKAVILDEEKDEDREDDDDGEGRAEGSPLADAWKPFV